jgi:hypothetical protein
MGLITHHMWVDGVVWSAEPGESHLGVIQEIMCRTWASYGHSRGNCKRERLAETRPNLTSSFYTVYTSADTKFQEGQTHTLLGELPEFVKNCGTLQESEEL